MRELPRPRCLAGCGEGRLEEVDLGLNSAALCRQWDRLPEVLVASCFAGVFKSRLGALLRKCWGFFPHQRLYVSHP